MCVRPDNCDVVVFDWELAGWGSPAADLAQVTAFSGMSANVDLETYQLSMRDTLPDLSAADVERLAACGSIFRALASLNWKSGNFANDWAWKSVDYVRPYYSEIAEALNAFELVPAGKHTDRVARGER